MAFLKNLLGGNKKGKDFQIQIDDTASTKSSSESKPAQAKEEKPKAVTTPAVEAPEPTTDSAPKAKAKSKKEKTFRGAKKQAPAATTKEAAPTPAKPKAKAKPVQPPVEVGGFATKYMNTGLGITNTRRRPGANMSSFLEMARKVRT